MKLLSTILVALVAVTGCSSTKYVSPQERNELYKQYVAEKNIPSVKKITSFRFNGWSALTDDYLLISMSPKRKLLVEVAGFCPNLRHANAILINQGTSATLMTKFDSISVLEEPTIKCSIKSIYKISQEQAKELSALGKIEEQAEN